MNYQNTHITAGAVMLIRDRMKITSGFRLSFIHSQKSSAVLHGRCLKDAASRNPLSRNARMTTGAANR